MLGQSRSTQRRKWHVPTDEPLLVRRMVKLASEYGRYGYRRIMALLRREGCTVNHRRVERLWRHEGLKVPARQPKLKRLWLGNGSCDRLRPAFKNHAWSYDFVYLQTNDGRPLRLLTLIDKYSRECRAIDVARRMTSESVLERLSDLFIHRGVHRYLRSDNGPEFTAIQVRQWLAQVEVTTLFIEPSSTCENGYIESFNGKLRDELLNGEIFEAIPETKVLIERWRVNYSTIRPHSALGYQPWQQTPCSRTSPLPLRSSRLVLLEKA